MKRLSVISLAVVCGAFFVAGANADRIGLGDFSGGEDVIDFTGFPAPPVGPFALGGVTFSENSTGSGGPGWRILNIDLNGDPMSPILTDNAGISEITLDFDTPQIRAGFFAGVGPATYRVSAFDADGNFLESADTSTIVVTFDSEFVAFENFAGISRLVMTEPSGENGLVGAIDDVHFEIPEPATLTLLAVGFLALRRRR